MFSAITNLYEENNINKKMTLRTQLKDVKMQMSERELQHVAERGPMLLSMKLRMNILQLRRKQGNISQVMRNMNFNLEGFNP